ncbi:MAG: tRNA (adenosine(37)-N6)-threonylcarbamoyltransferase complex ATPase subunit type 1 TsaE [Chthoniobacterales bacterium]
MANQKFHQEEIVTHSPAETESLGAKFAAILTAPVCLILSGTLGAGKTHFVRGIASALGAKNETTSPTFALVHEYKSTPPIAHLDFYRLKNEDDVWSVGLEDILADDLICIVEWGEKFQELLPKKHWRVDFELLNDSTRKIKFHYAS